MTTARTLIAHRFPHARWVILTGSVLTAARTLGSDLDIVVLLPDDDPLAPNRESLCFAGWPVELFIRDADSIEHYLTRELSERRPALCYGAGVPASWPPGLAHCPTLRSRVPGTRSRT